MLTHSSLVTKYECSLCSKSFERQRSYDRHMKIKHGKTLIVLAIRVVRQINIFTGSTVFRCPLCDIRSGRKDNILRHIRNLHSDENFDEIIKKISKTVARLKVPDAIKTVAIPDIKTTEELIVKQTPNVCQYQSVIQFAGRSKTPPAPSPQVPINVECPEEINTSAVVNVPENIVDHTEKSLRKPFDNELHVDLIEPNEPDPKISNISIYRQLLSPYLRPPPNLDFRNGSQEPDKHRGYQVPSGRLPMRKDNVDIYRSILMSTTDQEPKTVIHNNCVTTSVVQGDVKLTNSKTESLVIHGQSSEYFSEMHWRKRTSQCFTQME